MRLISVTQFINEYFHSGSRPTKTKVREWIRKGYIRGRTFGDDTYIDQYHFDSGAGEPENTDTQDDELCENPIIARLSIT